MVDAAEFFKGLPAGDDAALRDRLDAYNRAVDSWQAQRQTDLYAEIAALARRLGVPEGRPDLLAAASRRASESLDDAAAAVEACVAALRDRLVRESRAGMLPWGWVMASEEDL